MLIAEFAQSTGLTRDAVRFYVKRGLLKPRVTSATNRYQQFDAEDVERAALIRTAQMLGFTIREIMSMSSEFEAGRLDKPRQMQILRDRLADLDVQAKRIKTMRSYLKAKIAWMESGESGPEPRLDLLQAQRCTATATIA